MEVLFIACPFVRHEKRECLVLSLKATKCKGQKTSISKHLPRGFLFLPYTLKLYASCKPVVEARLLLCQGSDYNNQTTMPKSTDRKVKPFSFQINDLVNAHGPSECCCFVFFWWHDSRLGSFSLNSSRS